MPGDFIRSVSESRQRARDHVDRATAGRSNGSDAANAIEILNSCVSVEIACMLRYRFHLLAPIGFLSQSARAKFREHALDESMHLEWLCGRIRELGGTPDMSFNGLVNPSPASFASTSAVIDMIGEDLVAEWVAVDMYVDALRYFARQDLVTRQLLRRILAQEREHAVQLRVLLVEREGRPVLA